MKKLLLACAIATLAFSGAVAAGADDIDTSVSVSKIVAQQNEIRLDVKNERNGWDSYSEEKRGEVLRQQDRVLELLDGKESIADLNDADQLEVANLLESIKATTANAEDNRKVCTRERKMGSNFTHRVCRTVGQMRREREAGQDALRKRPQTPPTEGMGG